METPSDRVTPFPVLVTRTVTLGAVLWTLSIVFFVVQAIAQAASLRPYSLATNLISDLGNTACGPAVCSPLHTLVNATFIAVGLLHWGGAVASRRAWPQRRLSTTGVVLLSLAGWGLAYAGVFPENVAPIQHSFGAVLGLISLNLALMAFGVVLFQTGRRLGVLAVLSGVVGLLGLVLFFGPARVLPRGISERIADYPAAVMVVLLGVLLLVRIQSAREPASPELATIHRAPK